jgi:hypothetical protein
MVQFTAVEWFEPNYFLFTIKHSDNFTVKNLKKYNFWRGEIKGQINAQYLTSKKLAVQHTQQISLKF